MAEDNKRILVLGVGNLLYTDEGIGVRAVQEIERRYDVSPNVCLMNTGPCKSAITFVDGENGILRYRGYPIEQIAARGSFTETAWLLIFGELPTRDQLSRFSAALSNEELLHEDVKHHFEGFPPNGHPMTAASSSLLVVRPRMPV